MTPNDQDMQNMRAVDPGQEATTGRQSAGDFLRARAEAAEDVAERLRVLADEIDRARLSGTAEAALWDLIWKGIRV
jgi:hypothetical protein